MAFTGLHAISQKQIDVAEFVKRESCKYTKWSMEVVGICGTETSYGIDRENNEDTYGLMQISVDAARWIALKHRHLRFLRRLTRFQVSKLLEYNDRLSVEIASRMIDFLIRKHGRGKGIRRYNGINNHRYLVKVNKNTKFIRKILRNNK